MKSLLLVPIVPLLFLSMTALPTTSRAEAKPGSWRGQSITEFAPDESDALGWHIVTDGVMGGLSKGNFDMVDGGMLQFNGLLSLENNGGFSMVRSKPVDLNLSNDLGLLLRVKGDGRTYQARLESVARFRGMPVSFSQKFKTTPGKWQQVKLPFSAFEGSFRGRDLPDAKLDSSQVRRVGLMLADKLEGTFQMEVDWVRTYGKGQGNFVARETKSSGGSEGAGSSEPARLIETAVADGRFTILKQALDAAGLTVFFQWDNPLTVFAPTDEAFAKLPEGVLQNLLLPENKEKLVAVLSHHVSPGGHSLEKLTQEGSVDTVEGTAIRFESRGGKLYANDAHVIESDIACKDGIIHVLDTVLIPGKALD